MPFLLAILAAIGGALWFWARNNPRDALDTAKDIAVTAKNAPRRYAFKRQTNQHAVDAIDDQDTLICALAQGFLELDGPATTDNQQRLHVALRGQWRLGEDDANEMQAHAKWLISECGTPSQAMSRFARRLKKVDDGRSWDHLQDIFPRLVDGELSERQAEAISDLSRSFDR